MKHELTPTDGYLGMYKKIPEECVDYNRITVNQQLLNSNPTLNISDIIQKALYFSTPYEKNGTQQFSPPSYGRGIILKRGNIYDERGNYYSMVASVGNGPTQVNDFNFVQRDYIHEENPFGLTGMRGRLRDMETTEQWAAHDVLTTRAIALIPLNISRLRDWYSSNYPNSPYDITTALNVLKKNNDAPAIYIRLIRADRIYEVRNDNPKAQVRIKTGLKILYKQIVSNEAALVLPQTYRELLEDYTQLHFVKWNNENYLKAAQILSYVYGHNLGRIYRYSLPLPDVSGHNLDLAGSFIDAERKVCYRKPGSSLTKKIEIITHTAQLFDITLAQQVVSVTKALVRRISTPVPFSEQEDNELRTILAHRVVEGFKQGSA